MKGIGGQPFALGTFSSEHEGVFGAIVIDGAVFPLEQPRSVRSLLEHWEEEFPGLQQQADRRRTDQAPYQYGGVRTLPPVSPPGQIFQAGANYRQHVLELLAGAEHRGDNSDGIDDRQRAAARQALDERARSGAPFVFQGSAHAVVGAEDDVVLPRDSAQADWELELVAVIGRRARRVPRERAMECVAGYVIANDLTLRDRLSRPDVPGGLDWLAAKNPPTFLPLGPLLVPAAHVPDPMNLRIRLTVNGRVMQDESTADMLFDVAALIAYLSTIGELRPGDLVLTGSPSGNGAHHGVFLSPGDVIDGEIDGLGRQHNHCVAEEAAESPRLATAGEESRRESC